MLFLYPNDFLKPRQPDPAYADEVKAAQSLKQDWNLVSFEAPLNEDDVDKALQHIPPQTLSVRALYRGWMLRPEQYQAFYAALQKRHIELINSPEAYTYMHYLPESYPEIRPYTARSVWLSIEGNLDFGHIMQVIAIFGNKPIVVKDYVKSQKHYWREAFFIPDASNREEVERVVTRFVALQGADLNKGLVFREFVDLEQIGIHSKSGMPLTREYRLFCGTFPDTAFGLLHHQTTLLSCSTQPFARKRFCTAFI